MTVLSVDGLKTHFFTRGGVVPAVDGVSFKLDRGEVMGLVGESGSGKSTVVNGFMQRLAASGWRTARALPAASLQGVAVAGPSVHRGTAGAAPGKNLPRG